MKIIFKKKEDIERFASECAGLDGEVDVGRGSVSVDGKSVVGLFYFGLGLELEARISTDSPSAAQRFAEIAGMYAQER